MKTALRLFPVLLALCFTAAAHALTTISPTTHEVGAGTVPYQILVTSDEDWAASTAASWVTLSRTVGWLEGYIVVTAAANTTGADRSATIVVDGVTHTLTQRSAGTALQELWAWGSDSLGQLGVNASLSPGGPIQVSPLRISVSGVQSATVGALHSLIVKTDGSLWAIGDNRCGQLGDGTTAGRTVVVRVFSSGVRSVSAGSYYSLIVKTDGSLWAMGDNSCGQLGDGTKVNRSTPVQILAGGVQSVSAGGGNHSMWASYHSLIVKTDGSLWAMGDNWYGQLGDGTKVSRLSPVQILASGVRAVAAGVSHSLIVKTDGSLWGMGDNASGQLGDAMTTADQTSPGQVFISGVQSVAAGNRHSLVVKTDGSLWAMGQNGYGQLGDGTTTNRTSPVQILARGVQAVATGRVEYAWGAPNEPHAVSRSLFIKTDGSLWGMGDTDYGQGEITPIWASPVQILPGGVQSVAAGDSTNLIVETDGSLWAMGRGPGQLGHAAATTFQPRSMQVSAGEVQSVAAGWAHSLIVKTNGSLWAMGDNRYGQLGDGTTINRPSPVQILAGGVQSVSAGGVDYSMWANSHSLIVKPDGSLWAMGANSSGQLGDGTTDNRSTPVRILASGVRSASAGGWHSLIVKTDGSLWGMGANPYGQLGDGTTTYRKSPVQILASGVQSASAGGYHSLIVKTDGSLWAMGLAKDSEYWTTGDEWLSPVQILSSGVESVAAGSGHSLIVKTDGSLWAMGDALPRDYGYYNTLGHPVQIIASGVAAVVAGGHHSLVLKTDGSLWVMGDNASGQLGDGTVTSRTRPVLVARNVLKIAAGAAHSLIVASGDILPDVPFVWAQPESTGVLADGTTTLTVDATWSANIQWCRGGHAVAGGTGRTLTLSAIAPADAGIYDAVVSVGANRILSAPAVVGILPASGERTAGSVATRDEWQDIHHPNGAVYDQFVLTGAAGTFKAESGQIARCAYLDTKDSIVQVEMSGAGAITIVLDGATGPMDPVLYNQPGIQYMKGKASIVLAGADETTHFTIYSVGTGNNPAVTRPDATYNGWADVAVAGIVSTDGRLGGIHQGNVSYSAATGYTGIYAPYLYWIGGIAVVHGIEASGSAQPYLYFDPFLISEGGGVRVKIAGSSLSQPNGDSITVNGLAQVQMGAGQDSCGRAEPAQVIATRLFDDQENDVTITLVTGP